MDELRRARAGTWAAFFVTGVVAASWAARIPTVQDRLDLSAGGLAVAVLGLEAGALVGLPLGAVLSVRAGSRKALRLGLAIYAPLVLVAALAPSLPWLVAGLAVWAAANSIIDVALNAQGVELDRRYQRPVLSSLQAAQALGSLTGAATATAAASLDVPLSMHLAIVAGVSLTAGLVATGSLIDEPRAAPTTPDTRRRWRRPPRTLLLLGAVAFCATLIDGAANNWIAVSLSSVHVASAAAAAAGYLVFSAALFLGRLAGDRLVARLGRPTTIRTCGLLATAAALLGVLGPTLALAYAGWFLLGLALAPLLPTLLGAVPTVTDGPVPPALATVTTIAYLGSFTGPPLIGALAEASNLNLALLLLLLPAAALTSALLAQATRPATTAP